MNLIIDDEPRWIKFCRDECGLEVARDIDGIDYDRHHVIVISSRMLDYVPELAVVFSVIVATAQPTEQESIKAFRFGAVDYIVKDLRKDALLEKLKGY